MADEQFPPWYLDKTLKQNIDEPCREKFKELQKIALEIKTKPLTVVTGQEEKLSLEVIEKLQRRHFPSGDLPKSYDLLDNRIREEIAKLFDANLFNRRTSSQYRLQQRTDTLATCPQP